MSNDKRASCFVIMPFGKAGSDEEKHSTSVYNLMIKPVLKSHNYDTVRADELHHPGSITYDIIEKLFRSDLVVADLTGSNPNVFYELGVRHTLRKAGTIPIVKSDSDLPFDVKDNRTIFYSTDPQGVVDFKKELGDKIEALRKIKEKDPDWSDNPVHRAIGEELHYRSLSENEEDLKRIIQIYKLMEQAYKNNL